MKMDMIIRNAFVYNSFTQSFAKKDVAVKDGQFVWIHDHIEEDADVIVDGTGKYMIPGLVDIHMHIESSMSIPSRFSDAVLFHGTTTVVADPHEIAKAIKKISARPIAVPQDETAQRKAALTPARRSRASEYFQLRTDAQGNIPFLSGCAHAGCRVLFWQNPALPPIQQPASRLKQFRLASEGRKEQAKTKTFSGLFAADR